MSKSCVVISIQDVFRVNGLRIKVGGNGKYAVEKHFTGTYNESNGPGEALQQAMAILNAQNCNRIIIVAQVKRSSVFEMRMPALPPEEMRHAVEFELVKHTPLPLGEIVWSARVIPDDKSDDSEKATDGKSALTRLRIVFMERSGWAKLIAELQVRQIPVDVYLNPFMCIDPFASGEDVLLPAVDSEHIFFSGAEKGLRYMGNANGRSEGNDFRVALEESFEWQMETGDQEALDWGDFTACLLAARYVLSGEYDIYEKKLTLKLPPALLPKRNKLLKYFTVVNGVAALICLLLLAYQLRQEVYCVYVEQKNAISLVETQIRNLQKQNAASKKGEKLRQKILESVPADVDPLQILASMARKLPKYIWVCNYNMNGDKVYINLAGNQDPGDLLAKLRDDRVYTIDNVKKSRRYDGTHYFYLTLTPPEAVGGNR